VRVNFNYFIEDDTFEFILAAVHLVATHGWRLLPHYTFDPISGLWRHMFGPAEPPLSLFDVEFGASGLRYPQHRTTAPGSMLEDYLAWAEEILATAETTEPPAPLEAGDDFEHLRWFPLPHEV
jgi:hypothetical protein